MGATMEASLVAAALEKACEAAAPRGGVIFHSDQGSQYNSRQFRECLSNYRMLGSMSERGVCWDNAATESFWSILKREFNGKEGFDTRKSAEKVILDWFDFYNKSPSAQRNRQYESYCLRKSLWLIQKHSANESNSASFKSPLFWKADRGRHR